MTRPGSKAISDWSDGGGFKANSSNSSQEVLKSVAQLFATS